MNDSSLLPWSANRRQLTGGAGRGRAEPVTILSCLCIRQAPRRGSYSYSDAWNSSTHSQGSIMKHSKGWGWLLGNGRETKKSSAYANTTLPWYEAHQNQSPAIKRGFYWGADSTSCRQFGTVFTSAKSAEYQKHLFEKCCTPKETISSKSYRHPISLLANPDKRQLCNRRLKWGD